MYNNGCYPPVAKLDIAVDSDSKGRGFESLRADQQKSVLFTRMDFCFTTHFFHINQEQIFIMKSEAASLMNNGDSVNFIL